MLLIYEGILRVLNLFGDESRPSKQYCPTGHTAYGY